MTRRRAEPRCKSAVVPGICPAGWHLPDADELALLTDPAATGSDFLVSGRLWNSGQNKYGSTTKGYLLSATSVSACLLFYTSGGLVSFRKTSGGSVRCVKDAN